MKIRIFLLILLLVIGTSVETQYAAAQDDDLDIFGEMANGADEKKEEKYNPLTQIGTNTTGSLRLRYQHFFHTAEEGVIDDGPNFTDYLLKVSTFTGGNNWRIDLDMWGEYGTQENTYEPGVSKWFQDEINKRRILEINELYLTVNQEDFDLAAGKKIFKNGISTLYSPADRLRPCDWNDPLDPKDFGIWQIRADYYIDKLTITGAILPVYTQEKLPDSTSRWGNVSDVLSLAGPSVFEDDRADTEWKYVGFFAKVKGTWQGWDLFLSAYDGPGLFSVIKEEIRDFIPYRIRKTVNVANVGTGFSTAYKKWEFHGETLYNYSYEGRDDNYLSSVAGTIYTIDDWAKKVFLEQIVITLELGYEWKAKSQDADGYVVSSEQSRPGKRDIFTKIKFKYNDDLNFQYLSDFDLKNHSELIAVQSEYEIITNLLWSVVLEFFNGNESETPATPGVFSPIDYGRWKNNDRLVTALEYKF